MNALSDFFSRTALWTAHQSGRASTFALACLVVLAWAVSGPFFHFSDAWQLVINTGTTIITFLMIFLLQHAQNRDSTAIQLKLDELIRVNRDARNRLLTLEDLTELELQKVKADFAQIAGQEGTLAEVTELREDLEQAKGDIEQAKDRLDEVQTSISGGH